MEAFIESLLNTKVGLIVLGCIILTALIIEFFNNKPQI